MRCIRRLIIYQQLSKSTYELTHELTRAIANVLKEDGFNAEVCGSGVAASVLITTSYNTYELDLNIKTGIVSLLKISPYNIKNKKLNLDIKNPNFFKMISQNIK